MIPLPRNPTDILVDTLSPEALEWLCMVGDMPVVSVIRNEHTGKLFCEERPEIHELVEKGFYAYIPFVPGEMPDRVRLKRNFWAHEAHERIMCGEYERCKRLYAKRDMVTARDAEDQASMEAVDGWGAF